MTVVARLFKVTCHFAWQDKNETSTWHCASLDGAKRFIKRQKELEWYSIEGQNFIPCDEDDPTGQLYIGCTYHEFVELK